MVTFSQILWVLVIGAAILGAMRTLFLGSEPSVALAWALIPYVIARAFAALTTEVDMP